MESSSILENEQTCLTLQHRDKNSNVFPQPSSCKHPQELHEESSSFPARLQVSPSTSDRGWYPSSLYCLLILPGLSLRQRDPTLEEDVTGTATPLSTKPCANSAKRQIRHQKLSLWGHTAALSADEPANRWLHVSPCPLTLLLHTFFFFNSPSSHSLFFLSAWAQSVSTTTETVIILPNRACLSRPDATSPLSFSKKCFPDESELRLCELLRISACLGKWLQETTNFRLREPT